MKHTFLVYLDPEMADFLERLEREEASGTGHYVNRLLRQKALKSSRTVHAGLSSLELETTGYEAN